MVEPPDLRTPDIQPTLAGTFLLASGAQPILDGVTADGQALGYRDGTDGYVVATFPGPGAQKIAEGRYTTGAVVSGNVIVSLYAYANAAVRLSAWAPGDGQATMLESRAFPSRAAVSASPSGRYVAYVSVADLAGETGHVQIRRRDGSGVAVSPMVVRDIDLLRCATELRFFDETHLVAFYCQKATAVPRVVVVDAESGQTVALSDPAQESVEQVLLTPPVQGGGRVLWTNLLSSKLDPGALKAGTVAGDVRQVLSKSVPRKALAQLTLSPDGAAAYYLSATGTLVRVPVKTGGEVALTTDKVDKIAAISPDGRVAAVIRARAMPMPDRLSLIDTATKESVDPPLGSSLTLQGQLFTADSAYALYLTDGDTLAAFPVRGATGRPRVDVKTKVSRFAALQGSRLLVFHDAQAAGAVASTVDVTDPATLQRKDDGVNPSPSGTWVLTPDASKVLYVKGGGVYMTTPL